VISNLQVIFPPGLALVDGREEGHDDHQEHEFRHHHMGFINNHMLAVHADRSGGAHATP
jgi:hypothetical protein